MVKGNPRNHKEADLILDKLVRQTFLFLQDNPTHVMQEQPEGKRVLSEFDRELTDILMKAEILSCGYAAVLSGTQPPKKGSEFEGGKYNLVIYTLQGMRVWEEQGSVNTSLYIRLQKGTEPGIQHAVGEYTVDNLTVTFEEANRVMEGWWKINTYRPISITENIPPKPVISAATANIQKDAPAFQDVLAYQNGKTPLDKDGMPIPESLFPGARARFPTHPEGTRYEADNIGNIFCYFP